jgi:hypothetical protein
MDLAPDGYLAWHYSGREPRSGVASGLKFCRPSAGFNASDSLWRAFIPGGVTKAHRNELKHCSCKVDGKGVPAADL